jgi:hypothetical protein
MDVDDAGEAPKAQPQRRFRQGGWMQVDDGGNPVEAEQVRGQRRGLAGTRAGKAANGAGGQGRELVHTPTCR